MSRTTGYGNRFCSSSASGDKRGGPCCDAVRTATATPINSATTTVTLILLLGAARVALRGHLDRPDLRGVRHLVAPGILRAAREDEQRLLVASAERAADDPAGCGNDAEMRAV